MDLVEIVNLTKFNGKYKAVQLYVDKKPVLLLGKTLHGSILSRFLMDRCIDFKTMEDKELEFPYLEGKRYNVVGMGIINMHPKMKVCSGMSGENHYYKIGIDIEHLEKVKETLRMQGWQCI